MDSKPKASYSSATHSSTYSPTTNFRGNIDTSADQQSAEHFSLASAILDQQQTGIVVLNHHRKVICWNNWIADWTNISPDKALGKTLETLFPDLIGTELPNTVTRALENSGDIIWSQETDPERMDIVEAAMSQGDRELPLFRISISSIASPDGSGCVLELLEAPFNPLTVRNAELSKSAQKNTKDISAALSVVSESAREISQAYAEGGLADQNLSDQSVGIISVDRFSMITDVNNSFQTMSDFSSAQLRDKPLRLLFPAMSAGTETEVAQFFEQYSHRDEAVEAVTAEGNTLRLHVSVHPVAGGDGQLLVCRDKSGELDRENALLRERELFAALYSEVADGVALVDAQGLIEGVNPVGLEMLGLRQTELHNQPADQLISLVDSKNITLKAVTECLARGSVFYAPSNTTLQAAGGDSVPVTVSVTPLRGNNNELSGCVVVFRTVAESRRVSQRLSWQVDHDPLTGLYNRHALEREIRQSMGDVQRSNLVSILLYIDLYNFSLVNDTCGHSAGDTLLCQTAKILQGKAGKQALVARIGNDEFGILLRDQQVDVAQVVAEDILEEFKVFSFPWGERRLKVGANIGMEVIDRNASSEIDILVSAAASCETSKEFGRNRLHSAYQREDIDQRDRIAQWIPKISAALDENRFELYFQPIVPMASLADVSQSKTGGHYEALVRMIDENGQLVSPDEFIPAAERYGLIDDIDRWVVAEAIRIITGLNKNRRRGLRIAVNLSGATIGDDTYAEYLLKLLDSSGVDPSHLQFEITETAAIRQFDRAMDFIHRLKAKGCFFSLDDFGSGLSSLSYLKEIPVDFLKIDGSFVRNMESSDIDFSVVSTVNHLAHVMGVLTIAESVENQFQLTMLQDMGVDYVQGYFLATPKPAADVFG
ncbi:MAG: EAL domain-containing protein [Porticoccaceae bacterium]